MLIQFWPPFYDDPFLKHKKSYKLINSVSSTAKGDNNSDIDYKEFVILDIEIFFTQVFEGKVTADYKTNNIEKYK
jgi:hypothetical protein